MATPAASGHGRNTRAPSQSSSLPETEEKRQGVQALNLPSASEGRGLNPAASGATKKIGELPFPVLNLPYGASPLQNKPTILA
jgi:hypothetical protein